MRLVCTETSRPHIQLVGYPLREVHSSPIYIDEEKQGSNYWALRHRNSFRCVASKARCGQSRKLFVNQRTPLQFLSYINVLEPIVSCFQQYSNCWLSWLESP